MIPGSQGWQQQDLAQLPQVPSSLQGLTAAGRCRGHGATTGDDGLVGWGRRSHTGSRRLPKFSAGERCPPAGGLLTPPQYLYFCSLRGIFSRILKYEASARPELSPMSGGHGTNWKMEENAPGAKLPPAPCPEHPTGAHGLTWGGHPTAPPHPMSLHPRPLGGPQRVSWGEPARHGEAASANTAHLGRAGRPGERGDRQHLPNIGRSPTPAWRCGRARSAS